MDQYRLYEKEPAAAFEDAHLLGNGSLGATVFGGVPCERILINHDTLWSGSEKSKINSATKRNLQRARSLVLEGRLKEANNLINDEMLGYWTEAYLPLGNLYLMIGQSGDQRSMKQRRILLNETPYADYKRVLVLGEAVERIEYNQRGTHYVREFFTSHADDVLAIRLTADGGTLDFSIGMDSPLKHEARVSGSIIAITGRAPDRVECYSPCYYPKVSYRDDNSSNALRFASIAAIAQTDGDVSGDEFRLYVRNASYAVILLSAGTNYAGYQVERDRNTGHVLEKCMETIRRASQKPFSQLRAAHIADYQALYARFSLTLGKSITGQLPTSQRLKIYKNIDDPSISALAVQYSRYLLISFSRPGSQPGNLQGIWNPDVCPPWACNYTTNINVEMNYWGAEVLNLSECHLPLSNMVGELADSGRETAEKLYGARGWVTHHNTDLWRMTTQAGEDAAWSWWAFGGVWLCRHLWEHFEFTQDKEYLKESVYPILQGAVEFIIDFVTRDRDGRIVTAPSTSPENKFFLPGGSMKEVLTDVSSENRFSPNQKNICAVCKASTMDIAMIKELLTDFCNAQEILQCEKIYRTEIRRILDSLYPFQIGKKGQLQEWDEDYEECTPGMGHVSHLYSVYPACVINADDTPDLFGAAHNSLLIRSQHGGAKQDWPGSWGLCLFARFGDGVMCNRISSSIASNLGANFLVKGYWQIDAIMGWGAGIAEMLIQSQEELIRLLPALPFSWRSGSVQGIRARGGFMLDMKWEDAKLVRVAITSEKGGLCRVRYGKFATEVMVSPGEKVVLDNSLEAI